MISIDLNGDLGEFPDRLDHDERIAEYLISLNIACGGHAGDAGTMTHLVALGASLGKRLGAHPSYADKANFGRVSLSLDPAALRASVASQVALLSDIAAAHRQRLTHVKPHGALYHDAMHNARVAEAVARGVADVDPALALVGQAGAPALAWWARAGHAVIPEAFADRAYEPDGTLRARSHPGALITDPSATAAQALSIARDGCVIATNGDRLPVHARTICIHADTPGSLEIARAVHRALTHASA